MNAKAILQALEAFGLPMLAAQLQPAIALNPTITDAELVSSEDGTLKHAIRGKIGWLVDFIWSDIEAATNARAALSTNP